MIRLLLGAAVVAGLIGAGSASAQDAPASAYAINWGGAYVGLNASGQQALYKFNTSTVPNSYLPSPADVAAVNGAGALDARPWGFGGGLQAGYNWQAGRWVAGIEADIDAMNMRGLATSNAVHYPVGPGVFVQGAGHGFIVAAPIDQFVMTDYGDSDWLATFRARLGYAQGNWLYYVTGGLALTQFKEDMLFTDGVAALAVGLEQEARINDVWKAGVAAGAGVEASLTNNLSLRAEYLHVQFGTAGAGQTLNTVAILAPGKNQIFSNSAGFSADIMRLGLNYKFGAANLPASDPPILALKAPVWKGPLWTPTASPWEFEAGTRLWFSTGTVGAPQPLLNQPPLPSVLISRLSYAGLDAISGEVFARADHTSGVFIKGNLGAGGITRGGLYDEDFPAVLAPFAGNAYSNTIESNAQGDIGYATVDLGYNFVTAPRAKLGAFVGYNYYTQEINTYGCNQLAGSPECSPGAVSPNILGISEEDHFNSLRVGLSSEVMLADRLKFTADAAYLPWVTFDGVNHHNARELLLWESADSGDGVMLEGTLGYQITDAWNVGIGARYWAWNTATGSLTFDNLGVASGPTQLARYTTERFGTFVQASYRWGDTAPAAASTGLPTKAPPRPFMTATAPMNWTGFYFGGHVGGGFADHRWSDPFGPTPGTMGTVNEAGFGDTTHASGPLGGGQVGVNWQGGPLVLGVEADADAADMRGENTCFSGLGGINCQNQIKSLWTATGHLGFAWDRSLAYVKGGSAWVKDTYSLNGNTAVLALGTGSTALDLHGWTIGGGVEYALTDRWSARAEYDHIFLPSAVVPFPTVAVINAQAISVKQNINAFKLGADYKFDLAALDAGAANR